MSVEISQRMFSEIMPAFTEMAEMFIMKTTSVDEKEKDEVKLHAALVLNITFWAIYEPRRDT